MSHRNHVSWPDKEVRLPELEMMRLADHLRRAQHYEEAILILLQLRPLMREVGIFDGQVVEGPLQNTVWFPSAQRLGSVALPAA